MQAGAQRALFFIEPMKALPVERLPEGEWLYEIKFDGCRAMAFKDGKDVLPASRRVAARPSPILQKCAFRRS